jgi:hypothetical protein
MVDANWATLDCGSSLITRSASPITHTASPITCNAPVAHRTSPGGNKNFKTVTHATEIAHDNSTTVDSSPGLIHENPAKLDRMVEFVGAKGPVVAFGGGDAQFPRAIVYFLPASRFFIRPGARFIVTRMHFM